MARGRVGLAYMVLLAVAASVPAVAGIGGWKRMEATSPAAPRQHAGGLHLEEQLHHAKMRLRASTTAAGAWVIAKKEKILTEEEIYAEKVRKFARSVDQVPAPRPRPLLLMHQGMRISRNSIHMYVCMYL